MADGQKKLQIRKISVVDQVCDAIKGYIADGTWKEGDKLPSEASLSDTFGVNRLSVRLALQKLSTLGIIETKVGDGSYVKKFSLQPYLKEIGTLYSGKDEQDDIKQFRSLIESDSLRLAAQFRTEEELAELKSRLDIYNECSRRYAADLENEQKLDELVESDLNFHNEIIAMTHNRVYMDVYAMVRTAIRRHIKTLLSSRMHRRVQDGLPLVTQNDTHIKMYEAVRDQDVTDIGDIMYVMFNYVPNEDYKPNEESKNKGDLNAMEMPKAWKKLEDMKIVRNATVQPET